MPRQLMKPITGKGVELRQIVGVRAGKNGEEQVVEQPIDLVYKDGVKLAVLDRASGAYLNFITPNVTQEEAAALHKEVTKLRIAAGGKNMPRQEGRCWSIPVDVARISSLTDDDLDAKLLEEAMQKYGLTPEDIDEPEQEDEDEQEGHSI